MGNVLAFLIQKFAVNYHLFRVGTQPSEVGSNRLSAEQEK